MNYRIAEKLCIAGAISRAASQTDSDLAGSRKERNATQFPAY